MSRTEAVLRALLAAHEKWDNLPTGVSLLERGTAFRAWRASLATAKAYVATLEQQASRTGPLVLRDAEPPPACPRCKRCREDVERFKSCMDNRQLKVLNCDYSKQVASS